MTDLPALHGRARTLLIGASGILGRALVRTLGEDAVATHCGRPSPGSVRFDALTMDVAEHWRDWDTPPARAIVMLGMTSIDECARDPASQDLNVTAVIRVLDQLLAHGVAPTFVSSDAVFDGSRPWWREDDAPLPILTYGRQKLAVEQHLARQGRGLVVRLPKLLADDADTGLVGDWLRALGQTGTLLCATDQFFTPASARDVAKALVTLVQRGVTGLVHLGGPQRLSRRELFDHLLDEYRQRAGSAAVRTQVRDCLLAELPLLQRRPLDTSLDTTRLREQHGLKLRPASTVVREAVRTHLAGTSP